MLNRALMIGLLLMAPAAAMAQSTAPSASSSPAETPIGPDGNAKVPNNVPDVIRTPDHDGAIRSKAINDPHAALEPPAIDAMFLTPRVPTQVGIEVDFRPWPSQPRVLAISPSQE